MEKTSALKKALVALVPLAIAGIGVLYFFFDPSSSGWFPRCPLRMLTGLPCPGCGSQRAIHALLHADFEGALRYNAMLPLFLPLIAILLLSSALRTSHPRFYAAVNSSTAIYVILVIVLLWWALRIVFGWYV